MADFDHALKTYKLTFIDFIAVKQFDIVSEIAQEPIQLPQGFWAAIEPTRNDMAGKSAWFENGQIYRVVRLLRVSTELCTLDANQKESIGDLVGGTAVGGVQARDLASHAAPSFWRG